MGKIREMLCRVKIWWIGIRLRNYDIDLAFVPDDSRVAHRIREKQYALADRRWALRKKLGPA